jgi:hypothetical protein
VHAIAAGAEHRESGVDGLALEIAVKRVDEQYDFVMLGLVHSKSALADLRSF